MNEIAKRLRERSVDRQTCRAAAELLERAENLAKAARAIAMRQPAVHADTPVEADEWAEFYSAVHLWDFTADLLSAVLPPQL